jgi:hypothetical protein
LIKFNFDKKNGQTGLLDERNGAREEEEFEMQKYETR